MRLEAWGRPSRAAPTLRDARTRVRLAEQRLRMRALRVRAEKERGRYATSIRISVSRSGMSTIASWPHGISYTRQPAVALAFSCAASNGPLL